MHGKNFVNKNSFAMKIILFGSSKQLCRTLKLVARIKLLKLFALSSTLKLHNYFDGL